MAEVNNQEIIQHKSIINDGTVFTEYFICNDSNSEKAKIYYAGNLCYNRINIIRKIKELQYVYDYYNNLTINQFLKKSYGWEIFCIIFWAFWGISCIIAIIFQPLAEASKAASINNIENSSLIKYSDWKIFCFIVFLCFIGFFIIMIIRNKYRKKQALKKIFNLKEKIIPPIIDKITDLNRQVTSYEKQMIDRNNCVIPQYYWDYGDIIAGYIYNSRASDLKEALNIFEMDRHNQLMRLEQQKQTELLQLQYKLSEYNAQMLKNINANIIISNLLKV